MDIVYSIPAILALMKRYGYSSCELFIPNDKPTGLHPAMNHPGEHDDQSVDVRLHRPPVEISALYYRRIPHQRIADTARQCRLI